MVRASSRVDGYLDMGSSDVGDWHLAVVLFIVQLSIGVCMLLRDSIQLWWLQALGLVDRSRYELDALVHESGKQIVRIGNKAKMALSKSTEELNAHDASTHENDAPSPRLKSLVHQTQISKVFKKLRVDDGANFAKLAQKVLLKPGRDIEHTTKAEKAVVSAFQETLKKSVFMSHIRYERNFVRSNSDEKLIVPPKYTAERAMYFLRPATLLSILAQSEPVARAVVNSVGLAFVASAFATLVWYAHVDLGTASKVIVATEKSLSHVLSGFGFFPAFLLLGLLTYVVDRWRDFLTNCHTVQARFHDIGVSVGGAVIDPRCEKTRSNLYKLYRYLNVAHAKTYASVCQQIPNNLSGFVPLCLLTKQEVSLLGKVPNKSRDVLIVWIRNVVENMIRDGQVRELSIDSSMFMTLRGICARHHDLFVRNMPNVLYAVCSVIVNYLMVLQVAHVALQLDPTTVVEEVYDDDNNLLYTRATDRRPILWTYVICVYVFSFMTASTYWIATSMIEVLVKPFAHGPDAYNADALLASTDRNLFASLRGMFDRSDADSKHSADYRKKVVRQRWRNAIKAVLVGRGKNAHTLDVVIETKDEDTGES